MSRAKLIIFFLLFVIFEFVQPDSTSAQYRKIDGRDGHLTWQFELKKETSEFDRAVAFMDAGKMQINGVENFGLLSGRWRPRSQHGLWGDLRWIVPVITMPPGPWGKNITTIEGELVDRSDQYNTIESIKSRWEGDGDNFTDWEAKDNSSLYYHGTATTSGGFPLVAVSTQTQSWPTGYFDDNDQWVSTPNEEHWPGGWALEPDPASPDFGKPIPGIFVSSKDIFFMTDDKYNGIRKNRVINDYGFPVGLDMEITGYSYANPRYEDIVFFNINIIYRTADQLRNPESRFYDPKRNHYDGTIDSVYFAFFVDPDLPGDWTPNPDQASPWAEDDYADVFDLDGDGSIDVFVTYDKQDFFQDADVASNIGPVSSYGINFFRTPLEDPSDPNSNQLGITGMHWFDQDLAFIPHDVTVKWEQILYALSAGRPDLLPPDEPVDWWFHGDDPNFDDLGLLRDFQESFEVDSRPDIMFWFSSGPFSISPGDTLPIHIGIVGGDNNPGALDADGFPMNPPEIRFADLFENVSRAQELYDNKFQGSGPPRAPTLKAVGTEQVDRNNLPIVLGEDGQITLYWDNVAESSRDIISKLLDFEGYKIYKSVFDPDANQTNWGTPIKGYDGTTILGWKPLQQYDLKNEFSGPDPFNPFFELGSNTGLQHVFIDKNVLNGVRYRYAITAYDHGDTSQFLAALESILGNDVRQTNIVDVIAGVRPEGYMSPVVDSLLTESSHLFGAATGSLFVDIIDPIAMKSTEYEVSFIDTEGDLTFSVMDIISGKRIVEESPTVWREDQASISEAIPIFDGVGLRIINHDVIELLEMKWENVESDTTDYVLSSWDAELSGIPKDSDYLILFGDSTSKLSIDPTAAKVPFQVFNISEDPDQTTPLDMSSLGQINGPWASGEIFLLFEPDRFNKTWAFSFTWEDRIDSTVSPPDTTDARPPSVGDVILVRIKKGLTNEDVYRFTTVGHSTREVTKADLNMIKVVPNPYLVFSSTELSTGTIFRQKEIRFTHLPPVCTIKIYTARGDHVRTLNHESSSIGEERWDLVTKENLDIAYGVYIFIVETPSGDKKIGKFAVVR